MMSKALCCIPLLFLYIICTSYCEDVALEFTNNPIAPVQPVLEGRSVQLTCSTNHPTHIRWTVNGVEISSSGRRVISQPTPTSSRLHVTRVDRVADGGAIGCEAGPSTNLVKSYTTQLDITWLDNPVVRLESPSDVSGVERVNGVTLLCEADVGSGDLQYHWYRNNDRLTIKSHRVDIKKKRLHIKQATAKDNGVYRCSIHLDGEFRESERNFVLCLVDHSLPQILMRPGDILLPPKSVAAFNCQFKSADAIEWFKNDNNVPFENGERVVIHKNGTLTIKDIHKRDEGFYTCAAYRSNEKTQLQKYSAKLKVAYLKPMTVQDFEPVISETRVVHAQLGHSFSLTCLSNKETNPPALVMWKNTENHLISDKGEVRVQDGTLVIDTVKQDHQGIYSCVQENMAGSVDMSIYIVVDPTPKITKNPSDAVINEGDPQTFECAVATTKNDKLYFDLKAFWNKIVDQNYLNVLNGRPQHSKKHTGEREFPQNLNMGNISSMDSANLESGHSESGIPMKKDQLVQKWLDDLNLDLYSIVWRRDSGRIVKEDQGRVDISSDGILRLSKSFLSDRGQYWCEAVTPGGLRVPSTPAVLSIRETLKFSPPPLSKRLELYTTGKVHCKVQGYPSPTVTWYKSLDSPLPDDVSSVNGTLLFSRTGKEHKGNYTCVAVNSQGSIQTTISIDVVVSPRFISPQPMEEVYVTEGDPVWLHCQVEGDPTPKTQWDRNLNMITSRDASYVDDGGDVDRIKQLENGTLYIRSSRQEDSDRYGCTAGNSAGLKREEVTLTVHPIGVENEDAMTSKAIFITMSVVGAYILLVVGLVLWCKIRRRRKLADSLANEKLENGDLELKDKEENRDREHDKLIENTPDPDTDNSVSRKNKCNGTTGPKPKNGSIANNRSGNSAANSGGDGSEVSRRSGQGGAYDRLILDKDMLGDFVNLGRGEFGEVFLATLQSSSALPEESHRIVMVKSLQQVAQKDECQLAEFKRQLDCFSKLRHDNVASVIGLCNQNQPHYMVFQYTDWGDMKQFLLSTRTPEEVEAQVKGEPSKVDSRSVHTPLTLAQQLSLVDGIARGMEAIADARILHKDLATRNCLITSKLGVKVSLVSLTKDVYSKEYCKHVNQVIPLRWLPSECVYDSDYSTKSDVYMFACTAWEIFHKGELPFIKLNDTSILSHLKNNTLKWRAHQDMPDSLVELLNQCWDVSPKNRPTFTEITRQLHKILSEHVAKRESVAEEE